MTGLRSASERVSSQECSRSGRNTRSASPRLRCKKTTNDTRFYHVIFETATPLQIFKKPLQSGSAPTSRILFIIDLDFSKTSRSSLYSHQWFHCHSCPLRLPLVKLKTALADFEHMMQPFLIRRSEQNARASPFRLVSKPSEDWLLFGDFRALNAINVPNRHSLPYIQECVSSLHSKVIFSTIELVRAYHQIPVAPEDLP